MSSKSRASLLGIILGSIFGLGGLFSGIYFGIIVPLRDNPGADKLPMPLIAISILLLLALSGYIIYMLVSRARRRRDRPPEW
ncbi:hypothetical protein [Massilia sp. CCM 8734]|uniref:hypothetical protein n=1 Tax=Massilia sp. CCM 8734 TaxID=2609283 RepID=UPI00142368AC|nr:hypothetical protein [Massilia sp. CCM 8734]NHZ94747.1 hypothetical protein [Massilia sp. CCM 8734]